MFVNCLIGNYNSIMSPSFLLSCVHFYESSNVNVGNVPTSFVEWTCNPISCLCKNIRHWSSNELPESQLKKFWHWLHSPKIFYSWDMTWHILRCKNNAYCTLWYLIFPLTTRQQKCYGYMTIFQLTAPKLAQSIGDTQLAQQGSVLTCNLRDGWHRSSLSMPCMVSTSFIMGSKLTCHTVVHSMIMSWGIFPNRHPQKHLNFILQILSPNRCHTQVCTFILEEMHHRMMLREWEHMWIKDLFNIALGHQSPINDCEVHVVLPKGCSPFKVEQDMTDRTLYHDNNTLSSNWNLCSAGHPNDRSLTGASIHHADHTELLIQRQTRHSQSWD